MRNLKRKKNYVIMQSFLWYVEGVRKRRWKQWRKITRQLPASENGSEKEDFGSWSQAGNFLTRRSNLKFQRADESAEPFFHHKYLMHLFAETSSLNLNVIKLKFAWFFSFQQDQRWKRVKTSERNKWRRRINYENNRLNNEMDS